MKAAIYRGPNNIRLEERPEPEARADNLIAEVLCCGICGSDVKLATIGHPRWKPPVIIGHEFCARLIHVGRTVTMLKINFGGSAWKILTTPLRGYVIVREYATPRRHWRAFNHLRKPGIHACLSDMSKKCLSVDDLFGRQHPEPWEGELIQMALVNY